MRFGVVTLFPDLVRDALSVGVVSRGIATGRVGLDLENPRDHAPGRYRRVDDRPFGGGPGMVMTPGPLTGAVRALRRRLAESPSVPAHAGCEDEKGSARGALPVHVVATGPQGRRFDQGMARDWSRRPAVLIIAGRYEGIDERVIETVVDEEVSLGDFVLSGGEYAAIAMIDAVARLVPGVLGSGASAQEDSFGESGLLDWPHYTRPEVFEGRAVPQALLSGDHERIARWRRDSAEARTRARRPDLVSGSDGAGPPIDKQQEQQGQ